MAYQNLSGSITTGGTSQTLSAARTGIPRKGWLVQNTSAGNLYVNDFGGAASTSDGTSYLIVPGALLSTDAMGGQDGVFQGSITINGATTGQTFVAREW
jgi:hypothetical protein